MSFNLCFLSGGLFHFWRSFFLFILSNFLTHIRLRVWYDSTPLFVNYFPQNWQPNGFIFAWISRCAFRLLIFLNSLLHCKHWKTRTVAPVAVFRRTNIRKSTVTELSRNLVALTSCWWSVGLCDSVVLNILGVLSVRDFSSSKMLASTKLTPRFPKPYRLLMI